MANETQINREIAENNATVINPALHHRPEMVAST